MAPAIAYVSLFVGGLWLGLVALHWRLHGVVSAVHAPLALFQCINLLITLWELVLFVYIDEIKARYAGKLKKLERGQLGSIFLFEPVALRDALSARYWSEVWAVYSLLDESYSDTGSFGWSIDTGNGFSTLVPTVLLALGMSLQERLMPARWLGILGVAANWQMLYGTVVYFMQYVVNRRWRKHGSTSGQIFVMVLCSNVTWVVFPALGLWASCRLILADRAPFAVFV
jgi:hypothetical protein